MGFFTPFDLTGLNLKLFINLRGVNKSVKVGLLRNTARTAAKLISPWASLYIWDCINDL